MVVFRPRPGTTIALGSVAYCYVSIGSNYYCSSPCVYLFPDIPSPTFTPMGSSFHIMYIFNVLFENDRKSIYMHDLNDRDYVLHL